MSKTFFGQALLIGFFLFDHGLSQLPFSDDFTSSPINMNGWTAGTSGSGNAVWTHPQNTDGDCPVLADIPCIVFDDQPGAGPATTQGTLTQTITVNQYQSSLDLSYDVRVSNGNGDATVTLACGAHFSVSGPTHTHGDSDPATDVSVTSPTEAEIMACVDAGGQVTITLTANTATSGNNDFVSFDNILLDGTPITTTAGQTTTSYTTTAAQRTTNAQTTQGETTGSVTTGTGSVTTGSATTGTGSQTTGVQTTEDIDTTDAQTTQGETTQVETTKTTENRRKKRRKRRKRRIERRRKRRANRRGSDSDSDSDSDDSSDDSSYSDSVSGSGSDSASSFRIQSMKEYNGNDVSSKRVLIPVIVSIIVGVLIIFSIGFGCFYLKKRRENSVQLEAQNDVC